MKRLTNPTYLIDATRNTYYATHITPQQKEHTHDHPL